MDELLPGLGIEGLWGHVDSVRPPDSSPCEINLYAGKIGRITKWLKDASPLSTSEVNISDCSICERWQRTDNQLAIQIHRGDLPRVTHME